MLPKSSTSDSRKDWFAVGDNKCFPNEVGGRATTAPEDVPAAMKRLLRDYNAKREKTFEDLLDFHYRFERILSFQDGNGCASRLLLFKECLRNGIIPFILPEDLKLYYSAASRIGKPNPATSATPAAWPRIASSMSRSISG